MRKHILTPITALIVCTAMGIVAYAQDEPTSKERAVAAAQTRQAVFKLLGFHMQPISDMARGKRDFDAALAERNARRIAALAPIIPDVFQAFDTREFDVDTEALPRIWDKLDEFREHAEELAEGAETFAAVAAGGDRREVLGAVRQFGGKCGDCHDRFREDDED